MKLTLQLKLLPTHEQAQALKRTLLRANEACNAISHTSWNAHTFKQFDIHRLCYTDTREAFGLSAQLVVRCIAKVADAYKLDKTVQRTFTLLGAVAFDDRILSYKASSVSLWTLDGRQTIPFVCGARQRELLARRHGESDLVYVRGTWYLCATADVEAAEPIDVDGTLGVDLGIVQIATDSDGQQWSGTQIKTVRERRFKHRQRLQMRHTRRARWQLRKQAKREHRFQKHINHEISKQLVHKAKTTRKTLALEDLTGIRQRTERTVPRAQRRSRTSWAFAQLRSFISYKAQLAGVPVVLVDSRNTSRTCSARGHCEQANRQSQASFCCHRCGYSLNADHNAAMNISRAAVNQPIVLRRFGGGASTSRCR